MSSSERSQDNNNWNPFSMEQWVAWVAATSIGVAGITSFFYVNFETKSSAAEYKDDQNRFQEDVFKRINRLEDKIDLLLKR